MVSVIHTMTGKGSKVAPFFQTFGPLSVNCYMVNI